MDSNRTANLFIIKLLENSFEKRLSLDDTTKVSKVQLKGKRTCIMCLGSKSFEKIKGIFTAKSAKEDKKSGLVFCFLAKLASSR
jgi:hypothetical protein